VATGVIDIGTNTLLLLIVDQQQRAIVDLCRFGRLGAGLDASGRMSAASIARSLSICLEYRAVLDRHGVDVPIIVGTQALREAINARDFVEPAESILRGHIEVISGTREAELAFLSVARALPELAGAPYLVVDVGGGSTEIITSDGAHAVSAVSLPIGAVRLSERHLRSDPPSAAELAALEADIDAQLASVALPMRSPIVGTAGTATTLASVALELAEYDGAAVTGVRLDPEEIGTLYRRFARLTTRARASIVGMEPARADVIVGGVAIYDRIARRTEAPVLITCDRGVRWGIAFERGS
jgi:exopolyphosphatase / guanosine-5'-triphosphate,3'-diphosphate pyrophosphatase